jgi:hypothetical protein
LKLKDSHNKGKEISPGTRISNNNALVKEVLKSELLKEAAGFHSLNEFEDTVYLYGTGDFDKLKTLSKKERDDSEYTFYFLREAQFFVSELWTIKDNSVYVRDGFLIVYQDFIEDGLTYKGALSAVNSNAEGDIKESIFTNEQINKAIISFGKDVMPNIDEFIKGGKFPNNELFFKGSIRAERALYFILEARSTTQLPIKIVSYCTALECFFTTDSTEVNYKIAERVALFLGTTPEEKKELFNTTKKAYGIRSRIIHGSSLKEKEAKLMMELSVKLDDILRKIINSDSKKFVLDDNKLSEYFIDRLFSDSTHQ